MDANRIKTQKWQQEPLVGCVSSTGKPYRISLKKGTVNKLLVFFLGGGLSWNEETAAKPMTAGTLLKKQESLYIRDISPVQLNLSHVGLLNANDHRNPFHDWYVLNIPYSSGDFHIGNNDYPYQNQKTETKVLHHHGQKNVTAALAALKEFFPSTPDTLAIMGVSAGGFGCLAHAPQIQALYPACKHVVVYSEGTHLHSPLWSNIAENVWKVRPELLEYIKSADLIVDLFRYAQDHMPPSTSFLHANSVWDKALVAMMYKMNHGKQLINSAALTEFHDTLLSATHMLKQDISNYSYYLTDYGKSKKDGTTPHIFAGTPKLLYSDMQDGIPLATWLSQAIGGYPTDVGSAFIEKS